MSLIYYSKCWILILYLYFNALRLIGFLFRDYATDSTFCFCNVGETFNCEIKCSSNQQTIRKREVLVSQNRNKVCYETFLIPRCTLALMVIKLCNLLCRICYLPTEGAKWIIKYRPTIIERKMKLFWRGVLAICSFVIVYTKKLLYFL